MSSIDKSFDKVVRSLISQAELAADSLRGIEQPLPEDLSSGEDAGPDITDRKAVRDFFKAEETQLNYHEAMTSSDRSKRSTAAVMSARIINDFMGSLERDTKLYGTSRIRSVALEASRRRRQGSPGGPLQNRMYSFLLALQGMVAT